MMKMIEAMRIAQTIQNPISPLSVPARSTLSQFGKTAALRFTQSQAKKGFEKDMDHQEDKESMTQNPNDKTGDVMSHSFGEGYATRSDEEGFGGIYGGNDSTSSDDKEGHKNVIHESHPEYDREQGSEVKETEKGRNQKTAD